LHGIVGVLHRPEDPVAVRVELGAVHPDKLPVRIFAAGTGARQQSRLAKIRVLTAHRSNARARCLRTPRQGCQQNHSSITYRAHSPSPPETRNQVDREAIEIGLIVSAVLYGLHLWRTKGVKRTYHRVESKPDGTYVETVEVENFAPGLSPF
jgi:hypothetical protein